MKTAVMIHRNKERATAWRALHFFRDLAKKTEHYHRIFGFIPTWRFRAEYQSPLRLGGNEKDPPAQDSLFYIEGKRPFSSVWIPILSVRFFPVEISNIPLHEKMQLRVAKSKKRKIRDLPVCEIHEARIVMPYIREDLARFVAEAIGDYQIRYLSVPNNGPLRKGKPLEKWQICT